MYVFVTFRKRSLWGRLEHLTSTKATTVNIKTYVYEGYVGLKLACSSMSVMDRILDAEGHVSFGFLSKN
jgi:hypothetical protein